MPRSNGILVACAEKIAQANEQLGRDFLQWLAVVDSELRTAQQALADHDGGDFTRWLEAETPFSHSQAYRILDSGRIIAALSPIGDKLPFNEAQCRELACIPEAKLPEVWQQILDKGQPITAALIRSETEDYREPTEEAPIDKQWCNMRRRIRTWADRWGTQTPLAYLENLVEELRTRADAK